MLENGFEEQLDSTKQFLTFEINNKLHIMNENMKKFSDVSALGANELRNLFESEILELQVKVGDIEENRKMFENMVKNNQMENGRKFTDIIDREEAYQKMFLELSNEYELGKSAFSEFKLKTSQKISSNTEKSQNNDLALKDVLESISTLKFSEDGFTKKLEEQNLEIENLKKSAKATVENFKGISAQHSTDKQNILKNREHLKKVQDQLDQHSDRFQSVSKSLNENLGKINSLPKIEKTVRLNSDNIEHMKKNLAVGLDGLEKDLDTLEEKTENIGDEILADMDRKFVGQTKMIAKVARDLVTQGEHLANQIESEKTVLATEIEEQAENRRKFNVDVQRKLASATDKLEKIDEISTDNSNMIAILTETNRKITQEFKNLQRSTDKSSQILEDKLTLPIDIQQKKHASLEQLVLSELERVEKKVAELSLNGKSLNSTLDKLKSTVQTREMQVLKSMETNRRLYGQLGQQLNTLEVRTIQGNDRN